MKTNSRKPEGRRRRNERGFFAVIVMITLLALMMVFVASNTGSLNQVSQELRIVERRQLQRAGLSEPPENTTLQSPANQTGFPNPQTAR